MRLLPTALLLTGSLACEPPVSAAVPAGPPTLALEVRVGDGAWSHDTAVYPLQDQAVSLRVARQPEAEPRWYQIFPDLDQMYKNANHPWEEDPYQWVGLDSIRYLRVERTDLRGQWEVEPLARPGWDPERSRFHHRDVGSSWYQVELHAPEGVAISPGLESSDARGLSPTVMRVSVRGGEGYLGWLTSFFNVPGLFGSVVGQSEHYLGVDCADVLVAAYHRWKGRPLDKNYNVAMLVELWPRVLELDLEGGEPSAPVAWGAQVQPGDIVAVRYPGRRQYQHIGALYRDADGDGLLGGEDLVLHAGPWPLQSARLDGGGFDGHVVVMRPQ
jgi:hypothetical protein